MSNERAAEYGFAMDYICDPNARPNVRVVDVGCGHGAQAIFGQLLRTVGCRVLQTDLRAGPGVVVDDITKSRLPTGRYDLVLCMSVLEHIPDYAAAMRHLFRICRPGGSVLVTAPMTDGPAVENVYVLPQCSLAPRIPAFICRQFSYEEMICWPVPAGTALYKTRFWRCWTGDHWRVGQRVGPFPIPVENPKDADLVGMIWRRE